MEIYPTQNHLRFSFESKGVDLDKVIGHANQAINMEPNIYAAEHFYDVENDYDLDEEGAKLFILDHNTTQGVVIGRPEKGVMQIVIPALSSEGDIAYAFYLLRALQWLYPELAIQKPDTISDFSQKGVDEATAHCRKNMEVYLTADVDDDDDDYDWDDSIRGYRMGMCLTMEMLKTQYAIADEDVEMEQLLNLAFAIFCRVQWKATVLPHAEHTLIPVDNGLHYYDEDGNCDGDLGMEDVVTVLNTNLFVHVIWSEIALRVNDRCKVVRRDDFYTAAIRCDNIEVFADGLYAISQMTDAEWEAFCKSVPGMMVKAPNTFILRWNPAISSLTRKRYNHCLKEFGEDWGINWSIYDWRQARKGDICYMLLEGPEEEHPGIIFKGRIRCNPYVDKDWKGTDKERHYVDVECWDVADINKSAWITPQQLEAALPEIDWRKGHSGELLTHKQAATIEKLWNQFRPNNREEDVLF